VRAAAQQQKHVWALVCLVLLLLLLLLLLRVCPLCWLAARLRCAAAAAAASGAKRKNKAVQRIACKCDEGEKGSKAMEVEERSPMPAAVRSMSHMRSKH